MIECHRTWLVTLCSYQTQTPKAKQEAAWRLAAHIFQDIEIKSIAQIYAALWVVPIS